MSTINQQQPTIRYPKPMLWIKHIILFFLHTRWFVGGICGFSLIIYPNQYTYTLIIVAIFTAILSKVLKRIFAVPRMYYNNNNASRGKYAMPSSHSMMLFYLTTYLSCTLYSLETSMMHHDITKIQNNKFCNIRCNTYVYRPIHYNNVLQHIQSVICCFNEARLSIIVLLLLLSSTLSYHRVLKKYHNISQILVGGLFGSLIGLIHHIYITALVKQYVNYYNIPSVYESPTYVVLLYNAVLAILGGVILDRNLRRMIKHIVYTRILRNKQQ